MDNTFTAQNKVIFKIAWLFVISSAIFVLMYIGYGMSSDRFGEPTPEGFGNFGAYIGGSVGALFAVASAALLFMTYRAQTELVNNQAKQLETQSAQVETQSKQLALTRQEVEFELARTCLSPIIKKVDTSFLATLLRYEYVGRAIVDIRVKPGFREPFRTPAPNNLINQVTSLAEYQDNHLRAEPDTKAAALFINTVATQVAQLSNNESAFEFYQFFNSLYKNTICIYDIVCRLHDEIGVLPLYLFDYLEWLKKSLPPLKEVYANVAEIKPSDEFISTAKILVEADERIHQLSNTQNNE